MSDCTCHYNLDLNLATQVQQLLFPKSWPTCSWCCIGVRNRMARGVGGDYFDFITMPDGCQAVFLGDVTGHGLHASLVMALVYGFIHRTTRGVCRPEEMMRQLNDFLQSFAARSELYNDLFSSTLFWGIIDPQSLEMQYVNAGHPPPLVVHEGSLHQLAPTAQPLGFFDRPEVSASTFRFAPGDRMLLYTDGIVEAAGPDGRLFGTPRLQNVLLSDGRDYLETLDAIFAALSAYTGRDDVDDDCTAIMVDFHRRW